MIFNLLVVLGVWGSQFFLVPKVSSGDELWVFFWLTLVSISSFLYSAKRRIDVSFFSLVLFCCLLSVLLNIQNVKATIFLLAFFNVFFACFAIKTIAERITLSKKGIGKILIRLWIVNYFVLVLCKLGIIFKGYELSGFYTMPWIMGCAACLSIPFIAGVKRWYLAILVIPVLLSKSTACVAIFSLMVALYCRVKFRFILIAILFALSYCYFFDSGIDTARFHVMRGSLKFFHSPIFGEGIGSWAHQGFARMNGKDLYYWRWAHNELFQVFSEMGVIGLISALAVIFNLFKRASLEMKYALFGVVSLSCVHPIFHLPRLIPFVLLIVSFILSGDSVEDKSIR